MTTTTRFLCSFLWAALLLFAGCGQSETVPVTGVLLHKGKPLPNFAVTFHPEVGRPSVAVTDAEGRFEMVYTDELKGVVRGKHKIYVLYAPPTIATYDVPPTPPEVELLHEKYGRRETTQKEIEITEPLTDLQLTLD